MPNYGYEAKSGDGQRVTGEIFADRLSNAISQLESQGLQVESIRIVVTVQDIAIARSAFYERIEKVLKDRENLIPALDSLADELPQPNARRDVRQFVSELKSGATAEQFVNRESTAAWLPLIVPGIGSSASAARYGQLLDDAMRETESRKSLRIALAYPIFLLIFVGLFFIFLIVMIVPTFDKMFSEFGLILPRPTLFLILISRQLTEHSLQSFFIAAVALGLIIVLMRLWIKFALSTRMLGMFTSGNTANVSAMAKFTGSLAELISIEAPLPEALRVAGRACKHRHFRAMSERLASELEVPGAQLRYSSVAHNFPSTLRYALGKEKDCAPNVRLLRELSQMYSERARQRGDWSSNILGPVSLIGVGFVVAYVVIALFMPLVSLITSLS